MTRRPTPHALTAAALCLAATWVVPALADSTPPSYTLSAPGGLPAPDPTASSPQVIFKVSPTDTIVAPPTLGSDGKQVTGSDGKPEFGSPLTVLSDSSGFDQQHLLVGLNEPTDPQTGKPEQLLGLGFYFNGLTPNGSLHFTLNTPNATPPELIPQTPGIVIHNPDGTTFSSVPQQGGGGTPPPGNSIPEPVSLVLWSTAAGLGALKARSLRRAN